MTDIEIIEREYECVLRNDHGCAHDCANCDLVMPSENILMAYEHAIRLLKAEKENRILIVPEGDYQFSLTKVG